MTSLYIHADLKSIQDKLDRFVLDGMTFDEAIETNGLIILGSGINEKPKTIAMEKADFSKHGMKFETEKELNQYIARRKKELSEGRGVPFPPRITAD